MKGKKEQSFKNPRFQKDWERFNAWLEERRRLGELSDNSYFSQRSVVRRWLSELEKNGIGNYREGLRRVPPKKEAVVKKFLTIVKAYGLLKKSVSFSLRGRRVGGVVKDVLFNKGGVFLLVELLVPDKDKGRQVIVPYSFIVKD